MTKSELLFIIHENPLTVKLSVYTISCKSAITLCPASLPIGGALGAPHRQMTNTDVYGMAKQTVDSWTCTRLLLWCNDDLLISSRRREARINDRKGYGPATV